MKMMINLSHQEQINRILVGCKDAYDIVKESVKAEDENDTDVALFLSELAAMQGVPEAQAWTAMKYNDLGTKENNKDYDKLYLYWLIAASKSGKGELLDHYNQVVSDRENFERLKKDLYINDYDYNYYGTWYGFDEGNNSRNLRVRNDFKAFYWYSEAVAHGHTGAMRSLAKMYMDGVSCEKDYAKAIELFTEANKYNESWVWFIADMYLTGGYGIEQDYKKAVYWYEQAIKYNKKHSFMEKWLKNLALAYDQIGDSKKAEKCLKKASKL